MRLPICLTEYAMYPQHFSILTAFASSSRSAMIMIYLVSSQFVSSFSALKLKDSLEVNPIVILSMDYSKTGLKAT